MFVGCGYCACMGWGRSWVIDEWGGCCFSVVSLWCVVVCHVVTALDHLYGCHVAVLAMWPLYPGVRRGWRMEVGTYLNEHDSDDMSSPSGRHGTSATLSPLSTWLCSFVTLVSLSMCAMRAVCS